MNDSSRLSRGTMIDGCVGVQRRLGVLVRTIFGNFFSCERMVMSLVVCLAFLLSLVQSETPLTWTSYDVSSTRPAPIPRREASVYFVVHWTSLT